MPIELVPLCTLRIQAKPPIEVGTGPAGTRVVVEITSIEVKGDRLRAQLEGVAVADWLLIGPEGTATLDIRATLRTDDGAIIFVQYDGKIAADWSQGVQLPATTYARAPLRNGRSTVRLAQPHPGRGQGERPRRSFARLRVVRGSIVSDLSGGP